MRDRERETFERFQKDVAEHTLTILKDDGLYRHVRCRRKNSYTYGFDIVTWPGYLAYTGDMGCYVFTRLPDMFEFFRHPCTPNLSFQYWAEKCCGMDKPDGIREWSEDFFRGAVKRDYDAYVERRDLAGPEAADLWEAIESQILCEADNSHEATAAVQQFSWNDDYVHEVFPDFWDHKLEDYTLRFLWCCYALTWAIARYDEQTTVPRPEPSGL